MKNLSVENIYTRQKAKELTKKNFWRLLGMMMLTGVIVFALTYGGIALLAHLTEAQWVSTVQPYSYETYIDPTTMGAGFFGGFAVLMLVVSLLGVGLNLGLLRALTDVAREEEKVPVSRVFSRMKYILKGWGLSIWVGFKLLLWVLPFYLVLAVLVAAMALAGSSSTDSLTGVSSIPLDQEVLMVIISVLPLLMMLLIFALVIPAMLRYFLSTYVLADEPSTGVFECVRKSKAMMKGHKWQLFKLPLPYLLKMYGWMLLIVIVMAIVMVAIQEVQSDVVGIVSIVVMIAAYVVFLWKLLVYALRSQVSMCVFYLKRKGETPAIPPEEEERIVAWQPAAEKTTPESVTSDDDHIACWNPGGEAKPEKE